jgi:hypothetical protein
VHATHAEVLGSVLLELVFVEHSAVFFAAMITTNRVNGYQPLFNCFAQGAVSFLFLLGFIGHLIQNLVEFIGRNDPIRGRYFG